LEFEKRPFSRSGTLATQRPRRAPITVQIGEKIKYLMNVLEILRNNLITLAEKMGFNVERFQKITGPSNSAS
jgi:hypothetical protein